MRQKHVRLETDEVWNGCMSKDNYRNGKGEIEWAFMSRKQSLGWCWVANEEVAIYLQDLRKLSYSFGLHSLVLFSVFLD